MTMTEIRWLINLMTKHELSDEVKAICLERIGEVEENLTAKPMQPNQGYAMQGQPVITLATGVAPQAASTLAALARQEMAPPPPPVQATPVPISREIVTGGGNGTQIRGKRKF